MPVIHSVSDGFQEALDYRTYLLADKSSNYDDEVVISVPNWTKRLQVQMKFQVFDSFNLISIIIFVLASKLVCNTNGVHEGAA